MKTETARITAQTEKSTETTSIRTRSERKYKEVWLVEDAPNANRKAFWTKIGVAFENKDGSWNLRLSAVPIGSNTLNIRDPKPAEQEGSAEGAALLKAAA